MIMSLEYVARVAMDYLDSMGIAADYSIYNQDRIMVETDDHIFIEDDVTADRWLIRNIMARYPPSAIKPD